MTAQGGDLLAWLDAAITDRERKATEAVDEYGADWYYDDGFVLARREDDMVATGSQDFLERKQGEHIAANDPASVLRRCAADRKLIAAHGPWTADERALIGEPASDQSCKGCGFNNQEEPMVTDYRGCPVLNALAEGYGWTEGER